MASATGIRIGLADNGRRMTLEEFQEAEEEEGYRYELARGVLEVTHVPGVPHGQVVWNLYAMIRDYQRDHPGVIRRAGGGSEFRLWMPVMVSGRNPDLAVVLAGSPKDWRGQRQPVLVGEVVSERGEDRDYRAKREEYLAVGALEYWIVDSKEGRVLVLVRDGDSWVERPCRDDQAIASVVLPGFTGRVAELWVDMEEEDEDAGGAGAGEAEA